MQGRPTAAGPLIFHRLVLPTSASCTGVSPSIKKTSSPSRNGAVVASKNMYWLEVPINPRKSRSFKVRARVSSTYATTTTAITAFVYVLDGQGSVDCLSALADHPVSRVAPDDDERARVSPCCTHIVRFFETPFFLLRSLPSRPGGRPIRARHSTAHASCRHRAWRRSTIPLLTITACWPASRSRLQAAPPS